MPAVRVLYATWGMFRSMPERLTKAQRMIIYCSAMAELDINDCNAILDEVALPPVTPNTFPSSERVAPFLRESPEYLREEILHPGSPRARALLATLRAQRKA